MMKKIVPLLVLAVVVAFGLGLSRAQDDSPAPLITIEDRVLYAQADPMSEAQALFDIRDVTLARVSPSGRYVVYMQVVPGAEDIPNSENWWFLPSVIGIYDHQSGQRRILTPQVEGVEEYDFIRYNSPVWAPGRDVFTFGVLTTDPAVIESGIYTYDPATDTTTHVNERFFIGYIDGNVGLELPTLNWDVMGIHYSTYNVDNERNAFVSEEVVLEPVAGAENRWYLLWVDMSFDGDEPPFPRMVTRRAVQGADGQGKLLLLDEEGLWYEIAPEDEGRSPANTPIQVSNSGQIQVYEYLAVVLEEEVLNRYDAFSLHRFLRLGDGALIPLSNADRLIPSPGGDRLIIETWLPDSDRWAYYNADGSSQSLDMARVIQWGDFHFEENRSCELTARMVLQDPPLSAVMQGETPLAVQDVPGAGGVVLGEIEFGDTMLVTAGSLCVDGQQWYEIRSYGLVGWVPEGGAGDYWLEMIVP